jgi:hypothetical protein
MTELKFEALKGETFTKIEVAEDNELIDFFTQNGKHYRMYHSQDCCESVTVDEIAGELSDLIGSPILDAREETSDKNPTGVTKERQDDSFTWTFYILATIKGSVTIRWYGESNGYYSESVELVEVRP